MATRPASKLNLQELGIQDEIELVDKQGRTDLASLTQRVDDITPPDNIDISEDGVKVYANYDVNELGWGCEDKTYYFDTAAEFSLGDRTYTKTNAKPAFGGVIGTPGDGQNHAIVMVSTEEDATYYSWNSTAYSFDYNGTTWYYCGGNYSYWGSPAVGISIIPDETLSLEDAARYMLDSAQVYVDDGKFSEITEPNSGYLFAGGGSQDDYSDATFKVSKEGVVTAQDVEINGESITDKIDNIIDDTTTSDDSTYSSSKIETELSAIEDEIDAIIDDTTSSASSTWSSSKIEEEIDSKSTTKTISGNPIEFTDGADAPLVKCTTAITGSQDLHGYDKPWVGGAGKNKYSVTAGEDGWENNVGGSHSNDNGVLVINCTNETYSGVFGKGIQASLVNNVPIAKTVSFDIKGSVATTIKVQNNSMAITTEYQRKYITIPANTGASVSIYGNGTANTIYVKNMAITEDGSTSYSPYSNICPISGFSEVDIDGCGKNLFNESLYYDLMSNPDYVDGFYNCKELQFKPNTTYILSQRATSAVTSPILLLNNVRHVNETGFFDLRTAGGNKSFTTDSTGLLYIGVYNNTTDGAVESRLYDCMVQIELGTSATDYEPFKDNSYTIDLNGTRYGGTLDVKSGKLVVTHVNVDMGTLNWTYDSTNDFFYTLISARKAGASFISSQYNNVGAKTDAEMASVANGSIASNPGGKYINVKDTRFIDATAFTTAMNGVQLVYELATPVEVDIAPTVIRSLLGNNYLSCSTGDMEIEYITEDFQPIVDLIEENAVSDMTGATSSTDGTHGLVPAPEAGDEDKFLKGDGTWGEAGGNVVYSSTPKIVGKWIDGVTDVYEVTMVTNHINPTGTDYSYFPDTFSKIISVTGSISGQVAGSSRYYAPMGGWFKQSNDNINIDCSVYLGNFGPDNVRVYYAFHDQSTITPGGMSCDEQTIVVRYLR